MGSSQDVAGRSMAQSKSKGIVLAVALAAAVGLHVQGLASERTFFEAIPEGDFEAVKALLKGGANPNVKHPALPLQVAIGWLLYDSELNAQQKKMVEHYGPRVVAKNFFKPDPRRTEIIKALLGAGADPNVKDIEGEAWMLHLAAGVPVPKAVKALLEAGANWNVKDRYGRTPLHWMVRGSTSSGVFRTPTSESHIEAIGVEMLLEAGADPNVKDKDGYTPLHLAAEFLKTEAIKALLEGGANPNVKDSGRGKTPLHLAAGLPRIYHPIGSNRTKAAKAAIKALLEGGADANVKDDEQWPPLWQLIHNKEPEVIKTLLEGGADPNVRGRLGKTALGYWMLRGNEIRRKIRRILIRYGAK